MSLKVFYNLNDKQIVKLFSRIFNCSADDMTRDLEQVRGRGGQGALRGVLLARHPPLFLVEHIVFPAENREQALGMRVEREAQLLASKVLKTRLTLLLSLERLQTLFGGS